MSRRQCLRARDIGDIKAAGRAPYIGQLNWRAKIFASQIPNHQADFLPVQLQFFLIDLDSQSGQIAVIKNALDKTLDQAGLAHPERAQQADFFLDHFGISTSK